MECGQQLPQQDEDKAVGCCTLGEGVWQDRTIRTDASIYHAKGVHVTCIVHALHCGSESAWPAEAAVGS